MFAKGEGGFLDRDLYPFCFNISDGKIHPFANPNGKQLFGQDARNNKDSTGKAFGLEQYAAVQRPEGQITEVSCMFPKPGANTTPVPKVSFMTRAGAAASAITSRPLQNQPSCGAPSYGAADRRPERRQKPVF
jgi:single cache domain-containing protein